MTDKQYKELELWLKENNNLFPPTNSTPTPKQKEEMFYWANLLDSSKTHKASGCGRCYYNARTAIMKALTIF